jgi:hypothetical protein
MNDLAPRHQNEELAPLADIARRERRAGYQRYAALIIITLSLVYFFALK